MMSQACFLSDGRPYHGSAPQRKRTAVACDRCRKRKIRCSGDPGQGKPCSNCKNAGVDQCQFLRVSSREAPIRPDASDFGYSVSDARVFASHMPYTQGFPAYPAMHAYSGGYPADSEFGIGVASSSMMAPEPVGMLPEQWNSRGRRKPPSFSSMYLDTYGGYSSYNSNNSLHRPFHSASSDSSNFSFSNAATSLPLASTPGPNRLLPNPTGRSSMSPYPGTLKPPAPSTTSLAATLANVTMAATYAGGFDTYSSAGSSRLSSHPSSTSRSNSDTEGIFLEQKCSIQRQGPSFNIHNYTASPRRDSAAGGLGGSSHGAFISGESAHEAASHRTSHHHLLVSATPYISNAPSSLNAHPRGQHSGAAGGGSTSHSGHDEGRPAAMASRH